MKAQLIVFAVLAGITCSSCERKDTVRSVSIPPTKFFSHSYPSPDATTPVVYQIICGGDPTVVQFAVFGDGSHIVMGFSSGQSGGAEFTMQDQATKEEWTLSLAEHDQVIVGPDRNIRSIPGFATYEGGGLKFDGTESPLLRSAVAIYELKAQRQN